MSVETQEILRICEALPEAKRGEVADFARFLLARQGDEAWEHILADTAPRPRLVSFLRDSAADGGEQPLDPSRQ
jgi:hypothetical protein